MPKLVVTAGPTSGLEYPIKDNVILGRDPRCQVLIASREVSAQHARITRVGDRYYLEDLRSRNGSYLNEKPVEREALKDGDVVRIGRVTFRFELRAMEREEERRLQQPPESSHVTVELDATRDVFLLNAVTVSSGSRRLDHVLKLLCNLSRSIGSVSGLKVTLDEIAATLLELFPQAGRVVILLGSDGSGLEPLVTRWRGNPVAAPHQYSETIVRKALSERRAILTVDALSDDRFSSSRSVLDLRLRSLMCVPILHQERLLGAVEIDTLGTTRMFTEEDLNLMTGVVAQLAFAVANASLFDDLRGMATGVVASLTAALGLRSPATLAHCERVSRFALAMARRLELPAEEIEVLRTAALLHDIGLIGAPDGDRGEPGLAAGAASTSVPQAANGRDTVEDPHAIPEPTGGFLHFNRHHEDGLMVARHHGPTDSRTDDGLTAHPEQAAEILGPLKPLAPVVTLVLAHHERFDGRGYPRGLAGTDIPLGARILAIADAFDAMTAFGYYQPTRSPEAALEVLRSEAGRQFDPELVVLFGQIWEARQRLEARRNA